MASGGNSLAAGSPLPSKNTTSIRLRERALTSLDEIATPPVSTQTLSTMWSGTLLSSPPFLMTRAPLL